MDFIFFLSSFSLSLCVTSGTWFEPTSYYRQGHFIIGGMFPLHTNVEREDNYTLLSQPTVPICSQYLFRGFRWMQAMLFAIEEINNSSDLLPDVELGWKIYDTCDVTSRSVTQAIDIVRDNEGNATSGDVGVLVGPTSSDNSMAVANILGVFDIPQISYGSTTRTLSDKTNFNSFLRTIPNDDEQATAIADLLTFYNWTWVGAIGGDDEYGRPGIAKFKQEARSRGICIEFEEYLSRSTPTEEVDELAERIQNYNATVFVLFMGSGPLRELSSKLNEKGVNGKIWVASEAVATSRNILSKGGKALHGTLGIAIRGGEMKGFRRFLESVSPASQSSNPFIKDFWEKAFKCSCNSDVCYPGEKTKEKEISGSAATPPPPCTGNEDFSTIENDNPYLHWTDIELEKSYTAYLAIYTVAHALQNITKCKEGSGLLKDGKCPNIKTLKPWQLLAYLKKVDFKAPGLNEMFGFDSNGDPNATYKMVSWVPNGTDSQDVDFVHVANYSKQHTNRWSIDTTAIFWRDENGTQIFEPPLSICSLPCQPGSYRVKLASDCCHKCIPCPMGEYSNSTNANRCLKCPKVEMSNENRTFCVPKPEEYIRWNDAYGITFTCCSILGVLLTLFSAVIFFRHRATPIVKATNVEISFLLFFSLTCCFLTPLIYIAKPEDWSCRGRQVSFILSFTFCVAAILVKTLRVLTAFKSTMPLNSRKRGRWLGEHLQILVVLLVALVQVILCVTWLVVAPPKVTVDDNPFDRIYILCDPGNLVLMICTQVYLAILALMAFVFAFRARKLPENFNEAKFITFSMLVFFIVWLSFIPAYLSTRGVMATALYCIGILASTFGILGCIFFPKLYVILITPENNTTERVRMTTVSHAFRSASRSVVYQINTEKRSNATSMTTSKETDSTTPSASPRISYVGSPCIARALKNSQNQTRRRTLSVDPRSGPRSGQEYSIEINGKMTSSVMSPTSKKPSRRESELKSSFGVKLQVNIEQEQNSSEDNVSNETTKSDDQMLPDGEEQSSVSFTRRKWKEYHRVPLNDTSMIVQTALKKSESCRDYSGINDSKTRTRLDVKQSKMYYRLRSSSA